LTTPPKGNLTKQYRCCFFLLLFIVVTLLSLGCAKRESAAQSEIRIGVVLPVSGSEADPGRFQKEGIELAVQQINQKGGINVREFGKKLPVKLVFYDDSSDPAKSASLVEHTMTTDNVVAVLGGYSSTLGEAESVMPDRYHTPWIATGAGATSIFSHGYRWIFGALSPVELLGSTAAQFLGSLVDQGKLRKGLRVALVVENTDHGEDYANGIQQWIKANPGYFEVVLNEKFAAGSPDFSALLQKVKDSHADIFLADAHLQDYVALEPQYVRTGMYHQMISYGARGPEREARKVLGKDADYLFAGNWWSENLPYPQSANFVQAYIAFTGHTTDSWYAAVAYDATRALAVAIENAGSLDKTAIRDALRIVTLKDSLLPGQVFHFGPTGQVLTPFVIVQNQPFGEADIVYPPDAANGKATAPKPRK
jgi:branched-chain amino acid transport system substrate-binding protein